MKQLKLGIVGLGRISQIWIRALSGIEGMHVQAVCDIDPGKTSNFQTLNAYDSVDKMLQAEKDLDAVIVATSTKTHFDIGRLILESGNNLVMEKPTACDMGSFEHLARLARDRSLILYNALHFSFSDELLWYIEHENYLEQQLGEQKAFISTFSDPYLGDAGISKENEGLVGSWFDSGPNALSVLAKIFGEIEVTYSFLGKEGFQVENIASHILLDAKANSRNRLFGSIMTTWSSGVNRKLSNVVYERGFVEIDHTLQSVSIIEPGRAVNVIYKHDGERLLTHYIGMVRDLLEKINECTDNVDSARVVYKQLFRAIDLNRRITDARK